MKLIKKLAGLFSKRKLPVQKVILPKQLPIKKVVAKTIGIIETAYSPQELVDWLKNKLDKRYNVSQVEILDVLHQDIYLGTIFAVQEEEIIYWVQIGTQNIYYSPKTSLTTRKSENFRLLIKTKDIKQIYATCIIQNEEIKVLELIEKRCDSDEERKLQCNEREFPCTLLEATETIKFS